jgi:hypothetical protein
MHKINITLSEMVEWRHEILITKRKAHNLSCVEILKDKTHLLASIKYNKYAIKIRLLQHAS